MGKQKNESTAVNQLIELVASQQPLPPDPSEDLMFATAMPRVTRKPKLSAPRMTGTVPPIRVAGEVEPLPRGRAPHGTEQKLKVSPPVRVMTAPPSRTITIPPLASPDLEVTNPGPDPMRPVPPLPAARPSDLPTSSFTYPTASSSTLPPANLPIAAPFEVSLATPRDSLERTAHEPWFDHVRAAQHEIGTQQVPRPSNWKFIARKMIVPMILFVILGVIIGAVIAFVRAADKPADGSLAGSTIVMSATSELPATPTEIAPAGEPAPAVAVTEPAPAVAVTEPAPAVAATESAPAVAVTESASPGASVLPAPAAVAAVAKTPSFVDVRIDSTPAGATVMLVDRGKSTFLGTTPMSAAIDPARSYELVFTSEGRPTRIEALEPTKTTHVAVELGALTGKRAAPATVKRAEPVAIQRLEPAVKRPEPARAARRAEPAPAAGLDAALEAAIDQPARPAGDGTLMVSSKPPCEILIDGKPTGLTTPQRSMKLPVGPHKVTLVNKAEGIKKTLSITITADQPTKLIQDFMR